jgi:hypothetical protein
MMTFEEFFAKKKINLNALKVLDIFMYDELHSHYQQMGEKSFDHTKKFLFNKLRHQYPLEATTITNVVDNSESNTLSGLKPGYTPRFKAVKPTGSNNA